MKISLLRRYYGEVKDQVSKYLAEDLWQSLLDIQRVLGQISFDDNFQGWIERDVVIPAGEDLAIANRLRPSIPRYRIILRSDKARVRDGNTAWDQRNVYLHNDEASDAIVTVAFLK